MRARAVVRKLHSCKGMPIKAFVRAVGVAERHLAGTGRPGSAAVCPGAAGSVVDAVEPAVWVLLVGWPKTVIAERVRSVTVLEDRGGEVAAGIRIAGSGDTDRAVPESTRAV